MKIKILGASTSAKKSGAGNPYVAPATLFLGMEGGVARVSMFLDDHPGNATFRLEKDDAIAFIEGLTKIYNLNKEAQ
jgi:hypothetical protein